MTKSSDLRIAIMCGDGIGQEVVPAAVSVLDAVALPFTFTELDAGWQTFQRVGTALPDETLSMLKSCHGAIFGAVSSPSYSVEGYSSPIIGIRKSLDLYANLRPIVSTPIEGTRPNVNFLVVRENTEGLYVKQERLVDNGQTAIANRVITRRAATRIAKMAFLEAERRRDQRGSALVTVVHKANVLSVTDGLFRECVFAVAKEYPHVHVEEQLVDSMLYRMILEPGRYDVIVAPNLYGDILSDGAAALVGGLGLIPSANIGDDFVLVEPVHGSAPDIAGKGIANPLAAIRAAAYLAERLGFVQHSVAIERSVQYVLRHGPYSPDLSGTARTDDVTQAVIDYLP